MTSRDAAVGLCDRDLEHTAGRTTPGEVDRHAERRSGASNELAHEAVRPVDPNVIGVADRQLVAQRAPRSNGVRTATEFAAV